MLVETRHIDIGTGRFVERIAPLSAHLRHFRGEPFAVQPFNRYSGPGEAIDKGVEFLPVLFAPDIERAAAGEEIVLAQETA